MQETKTTQNSNYEKIMDVFYVLQVLRNKYAGADPEVEDLIKEIENGGCFADNETHKTFALKVLKEFQKIDPHYIPFNIQHFLNGMNSFANSTDLNSQSLSLSHLKTLLTADQPDLSNHIERIHKNVISIALHQKKETPYKGSDCRFQEVLCEGLGITLKEE